ncbi:MAG: hypothetical protein CMO01_16140 [Thalassobius sp.]|nr:hypothetical protein [Thalassovita sp.]
MKNIYESAFMRIEYDEKIKFLVATWLEDTSKMNESQFKSEFLTYILFANRYTYDKVLINESQFNFNRDLKIQHWASSMINAKLLKKSENLKKAIVYRCETIHKATVQRMTEQMILPATKTLYFESKEDASSWLLEGSIIASKRKVFLFYNNVFTDFSEQVEKRIVSF